MAKELLLLSCSDKKLEYPTKLPAFEVYDGPYYRVLRKFLRGNLWPKNLAISALSAKYGLFGVIKEIESYDMRMSRREAANRAKECSETLKKWTAEEEISKINVVLGQEYQPAVAQALENIGTEHKYFYGGIGDKQSQVKEFLYRNTKERNKRDIERRPGQITYFIPDWDDMLDPEFDFDSDTFSEPDRKVRNNKHCNDLIKPTEMCNGVLVSLAQRQTSKGPLRKLEGTESGSLTPTSVRELLGLSQEQYLLGDCGAFSYISEEKPAISTEQAIALYELYDFDLGASVDHIPIGNLPEEERAARVETTCENAGKFIHMCRKRGNLFTPVGSIQGLSPEQYAENLGKYCEMGYRHVAIGGLVPLADHEIGEIVEAISKAADRQKNRPWIHLFGIYRPKLQAKFQELGIDSFDSASYFRKAWLRSDQNYLSANGKWYAAIRVPMTKDPRTRKRLEENGVAIDEAERQEREALNILVKYSRGQAQVNEVLDKVMGYDQQLTRSSEKKSMRDKYRQTLEEKPWQNCDCTFCRELGIHVLIFRGANRNKRRGAHNTAMLFGNLTAGHPCSEKSG